MADFIGALIGLYCPTPDVRTGQSLVEYALIIVLISIAIIAAMLALSGQIQNVFSRITGSLNRP